MSTFCPQCQTPSLETAKFCTGCGAPLQSVPERTTWLRSPGTAPPREWTDHAIETVARRFEQAGVQASIPRNSAVLDDQIEHIVCAIDRSSSMSSSFNSQISKLDAAIRANVSLILEKSQIDPRDHAGLIAFRSDAEVLMPLAPLSTHKKAIIEILQSLKPDNGTDINEALVAADGLLDWSVQGVVRRIVLLTDGQGGQPLETAKCLKSRGVVIDVIGVGPNPSGVDEKLLRQVASRIEGESRYCFIRDQYSLKTHYKTLAAKTARW